ncbi:MAG: hypothetical protein ACJ735_02535 [Actinomycetes bacterium]
MAANPWTVQRVLVHFARNGGPRIRMYVAANPSLPSEDVERLLHDDDAYVRCKAASNVGAPVSALAALAAPMSDPAWVLRAVAANPVCPAELADQVLTWLALGGAGDSDPQFDPVECTGHPGDVKIPVYSWYRDEASKPGADLHPLWRVRAAVTSTWPRIPGRVLMELAVDLRPEVRRSVARFKELTWHRLRDLRDDADPTVRRLAEAAWNNKRQTSGRKLAAWAWVRVAIAVVVVANVARLFTNHSGDADSSPSQPFLLPGLHRLPPGNDLVKAVGTPTDRQALPGGGYVIAGQLGTDGLDFLTVKASSSEIDVRLPSAVTAIGEDAEPVDDDLLMYAGNERTVYMSNESVGTTMVLTVRSVPSGAIKRVRVSFQGSHP